MSAITIIVSKKRWYCCCCCCCCCCCLLLDVFQDVTLIPMNFVLSLDVPESFNEVSGKYVAKKSSINHDIDAMRHRATRALLTRNDVVIVASVSCSKILVACCIMLCFLQTMDAKSLTLPYLLAQLFIYSIKSNSLWSRDATRIS